MDEIKRAVRPNCPGHGGNCVDDQAKAIFVLSKNWLGLIYALRCHIGSYVRKTLQRSLQRSRVSGLRSEKMRMRVRIIIHNASRDDALCIVLCYGENS